MGASLPLTSRRAFLGLGAALVAGCANGANGADGPAEPGPGSGPGSGGAPTPDLSKLTKEQHFEIWKQKAGTPYEVGSTHVPGVCQLPGPNKKVRFPDPDKYKGTTQVHGMCQLCSTVCGITGHVKDGRIIKIDGNPNDPNSRGKLCARGQAGLNHQYHPERQLYPIRRIGARGEGLWKRITWEEAYSEIATRLKAVLDSGKPDEFGFHQGRNRSPDITAGFLNAFGTPTAMNHRALCSGARRTANLIGLFETDWDLGDYEHSKYILNFGSNMFEAHQGHLCGAQRIQRARFEHGAKFVTFDVRMSNTAGNSDEFHMPKPGTDGAIALAMAHVIVKEGLANAEFVDAWSNASLADLWEVIKDYTPQWAETLSTVSAEVIARIAREFAAAAPACTTMCNRGTSAHLNGVNNDRAINMLNVLVGSVGQKGGLCWMFTGATDAKRFPPPKAAPAPKLNSVLVDPPEFALANTWNKMKVGEIIYSYLAKGRAKLQVYMTYNLDSPMTWPEMDLTRRVMCDENAIGFHVAINPFYNETASLADMVLPWTTYMERWDVDARGAYNLKPYLSMRRPMVTPLGEAKDLREILPELARRIGGDVAKWFPAEQSVESYMAEWVKNVPFDSAKHSSPMEYLAAVGAFEDPADKPYYAPFLKALKPEQMENSKVDETTGIITNQDGVGIGIMHQGKPVVGFKTPSRKFEIRSDFAAKVAANEDASDLIKLSGSTKAKNRPATHQSYVHRINAWPIYVQIDEHANLRDDQMIMTSFKWCVHNHGRTANLKWLSEIVHSNPAWINPDTARHFGLATGDWIEVTAHYSEMANKHLPTLELGTGPLRNTLKLPVVVTLGVHPKALAISNSLGHFEYSDVAQARRDPSARGQHVGMDRVGMRDPDWERNMWWEDHSNGDHKAWKRNTGHGWAQNRVLPVLPDFISGQQSFNDTVVTIAKL